MIEFHGVEKEFSGRGGGVAVKALDGIDLSIGRGEIFGIIGRSGAGKSTLIRVVNMLERPTAGRVSVDGVDMNALDSAGLRAARRSIAMLRALDAKLDDLDIEALRELRSRQDALAAQGLIHDLLLTGRR